MADTVDKSITPKGFWGLVLVFVCFSTCATFAQTAARQATNAVILSVENKVTVLRANAQREDPAYTNQVLDPGDRGRTYENSRAAVQLFDSSIVRYSENTIFTITHPPNSKESFIINLFKGAMYFFHRGRRDDVIITTPNSSAAIRGTEILVEYGLGGKTILTVLDGEAELSNPLGSLSLKGREQGVAEPGAPPRRTAVIQGHNVIQWFLYYPGVLDLAELPFTIEERETLHESVSAYLEGDLLQALGKYPDGRQPTSVAEKLYLAALLLAVGQVEKTESLLPVASLDSIPPKLAVLARSLRLLVMSVREPTAEAGGVSPMQSGKTSSSFALAESYYLQAHLKLSEALNAAQQATKLSPSFGFAWARVAELQFAFGKTKEALQSLNRALAHSPRNAQALALKGFLLAAENKTSESIEWFNKAIAVDPGLGNAWLGRGLCRIRRGELSGGKADLLVAAASEPQRSLFRSYLGKAYSLDEKPERALHELNLAKSLDTEDPTPWLYSALENWNENKIGSAVKDLKQSINHNDNRALFRSRLLLDQDRGVRSANLASIYSDASMPDVGLREAARALVYDYANPSAHLFISDSYNELRDPTRFNLRYETVWFNEFLLANLLAPAGGGRLSQSISQQEYSKLFEMDRLGIASSTRVRSDGDLQQLASQYGIHHSSSYAVNVSYERKDGVRPNNDLDVLDWEILLKQEITPKDSVLFLSKFHDLSAGDNFQYYDTSKSRPNFRYEEQESPVLVGGWHHEWSPGNHSLLLVSRLVNEQQFTDKAAPQLVLDKFPDGTIYGVEFKEYDVAYNNNFEAVSAEGAQILDLNRVSLVAGARIQSGDIQAENFLFNASPSSLFPSINGRADSPVDRATGYTYMTVEPVDHLWLTAGLCYDTVTFPANFRSPPIAGGHENHSQWGPKAGLVWNPVRQLTLRGAYAKSLGGVSLDQSYRLEPTQLSGFPQAFRTVISESLVGSVSAPAYEIVGVALDLSLGDTSYAGLQIDQLKSAVRRSVGTFVLQNGVVPSITRENLHYVENSLAIAYNQLLTENIFCGAKYQITEARLQDVLPDVPASVSAQADQDVKSLLHSSTVFLRAIHSSGFFAHIETVWHHQYNSGYTPALASDDFFQENLYFGYRFPRGRGEVRLGILNLGNQDYHLSPLTHYYEYPRTRTLEAKLRFAF